MQVKGVKIGDTFKTGKHSTATVVDFYELRSMVTGDVVGHQCIVKANGLSCNTYEVPFATVSRNKIEQ